MNSDDAKLPQQLVWATLILCALPALLNFVGVSFSAREIATVNSTGQLIHTILEWTSCCIALYTVIFAFTHYSVTRDVTTPVIGTALFFSGMIDAFRILAADGLILNVGTEQNFILFTWAISRTFNALFLIAGTAPFIWDWFPGRPRRQQRGTRFLVLVAILFGIMAYAIIQACALLTALPQTVYPGRISRPWDFLPLMLYVFAGSLVFPQFHRRYPSLFSHALMVSVIPQIESELYAAFGSSKLFDNGFNVASYLKIVSYLVPLAGLALGYVRAYKNEVTLRETEAKLRVAHDVQQRLLPDTPPDVPGFDLAGCSYPADVIGGDYFDYIPMQDGTLGIVVADVSGHEIGASIVAAQMRSYLRAMCQTQPDVSAIVTELNRFLATIVHNRWFVEMFFAELNPAAKSIVVAAAGHEGYLLEVSGRVRTLENSCPPLGVLDDGVIRCSSAISMAPDEILVLLTDGITEAKSATGELFGTQRVFETVHAHRHLSTREIMTVLLDKVASHRQQGPQLDDVTLVILKRLLA